MGLHHIVVENGEDKNLFYEEHYLIWNRSSIDVATLKVSQGRWTMEAGDSINKSTDTTIGNIITLRAQSKFSSSRVH